MAIAIITAVMYNQNAIPDPMYCDAVNNCHDRKLIFVLSATEKILQRDSSQVDKKMDEKFSALHIAANNDHVECVRLLVKTVCFLLFLKRNCFIIIKTFNMYILHQKNYHTILSYLIPMSKPVV